MKKLFVSLLFLIALDRVYGQTLNWVNQAGATGKTNYTSNLVVDGLGNTYVIGSFTGTTNFGGITLTPIGMQDIFFAKYDNLGNLAWVKQLGSANQYQNGYKIAIDGSAIYITGAFVGAVNFGGTTLTPLSLQAIFIAKYDFSGTLIWVNKADSVTSSYYFGLGTGISIDGSGNVYITGVINGTINFGGTASGTTITSIGYTDFFLAKYSNQGIFNWVINKGSPSIMSNNYNTYSFGVTTDNLGNAYVIGNFQGTTNFGGTTLTPLGKADIFIAKYTNIGELVWIKQAGGTIAGGSTSDNYANGIAVDGSQNVFVTGSFNGPITFSGSALSSSAGVYNLFFAKFNDVGTLTYVKQAYVGASSESKGVAIALDAASNIYLTGSFRGSADFGGTSLSTSGKIQNIFIAKYNNLGVLAWVKQGSGGTYDVFDVYGGNGIIIDNNNKIYVSGSFGGITSFLGTTRASIGTTDAFILSLSQNSCPSTLAPTGTITTNQKAATTVITTGTNSIPNAANVIYQAGDFVQLNPGFVANNSSVFQVRILTGCN